MSIVDDKAKFLRDLPKKGMIGNIAFCRDTLGWSEERYWKVHALLIADGKIQKGRGKGGTVGRL
jgi:hypothetical protein